MGGTISTGKNNDELVDNLLEVGRIKSALVERICRSVDRAFYFYPKDVKHAYKDFAWKRGNTHLSAPCIYSEVMENLDLEPGLSFLNIGSGTGYLSTMVGLVLGSSGVNHGIELHEDVINYANEKLELFKTTSNALDMFDFCEPVFIKGNSLNLKITRQYDRVYCGAECPKKYEEYIKDLIKVGGVLVMPIEDTLMKYKRISETTWVPASVLPVSFAPLMIPDPEDKMDSILLPSVEPLTLQALCRSVIRNILRNTAKQEHPEIEVMNRNRTTKKKSSRQWSTYPVVPALHISPPSLSSSMGSSLQLTLSSRDLALSGELASIQPRSIQLGFGSRFSGDDDSLDDSDDSSSSSLNSADFLFRDLQDVSDDDSDTSSNDSDVDLNKTAESVETDAGSTSPKRSSSKRESADSSDGESNESENGSVKKRTKRESSEENKQKVLAFCFKSTSNPEESSSSDFSFTSAAANEAENKKQKEQSTAEESSSLDISFSSAISNDMEVDADIRTLVIKKKMVNGLSSSISLDSDSDSDSDSDESGDESKMKKTKVNTDDKEDETEAKSEVNGDCDEEMPSKSAPAVTYSTVMKSKVKALPLPHALKCYLNYYREF